MTNELEQQILKTNELQDRFHEIVENAQEYVNDLQEQAYDLESGLRGCDYDYPNGVSKTVGNYEVVLYEYGKKLSIMPVRDYCHWSSQNKNEVKVFEMDDYGRPLEPIPEETIETYMPVEQFYETVEELSNIINSPEFYEFTEKEKELYGQSEELEELHVIENGITEMAAEIRKWMSE